MAKLRSLTSVAVMVAMLMAALPATAFAHDDEVQFNNCRLILGVVALGTDFLDGDELVNSGQMTFGVLDCGAVTFDGFDMIATPDHPLDGLISTTHGSDVTVTPDPAFPFVAFDGELEGEMELVTLLGGLTLTGDFSVDVAGTGVLTGVPTPPGPALLPFTEVFTNGEFELEGDDIEVEGTFSAAMITLGVFFSGDASGDMEFDD